MKLIQIGIDLIRMLMTPGVFIFGIYELLVSWVRSRRWLSLVYLVPIIGLLSAMFGHAYWHWNKRDSLLDDYWVWIEAETDSKPIRLTEAEMGFDPAADADSHSIQEPDQPGKLIEEENISPYTEMLIRRTLVLDSSNTRATYLAASVLGNQGKLGQARQMMRIIAPKGSRGYPPAHAWLAANHLQELRVKNQQELTILLHDLSVAQNWTGTSPLLMSIYSDLLVQERRVNEAIGVLRTAVNQDPTLVIKIAGLAQQHNRPELFGEIQKEMKAIREERIDKGLGTELDYVCVASLMLLDDQVDPAVVLIQSGLVQHRGSERLQRLLSNAFVVKFDGVRENSEIPEENKLELLDLAMKADPTSMHVLERIGNLVAKKSLSSDQVAARLREHLASGKMTAISHLLLAIGHLREENLEKAMVHLEIAHNMSPNNPIIMNNLSLCIARTRPNELPRARQLIERALAIGGSHSERLDTYGEVLALGGDYLAAIRAYEAALAQDPHAQETRSKLADVYEKVSMNEMAEAVRNSKPTQ